MKTTPELIAEARRMVDLHPNFLWAQMLSEVVDRLAELHELQEMLS